MSECEHAVIQDVSCASTSAICRKPLVTLLVSLCAKIKRSCEDILTCLCLEDEEAKCVCRMFLRWYIDHHPLVKVLVLGSQGYELRSGVNTVTAVLKLWVRILAEFDSTVLPSKRRVERDDLKRLTWRLIQPSWKGSVPSKTYPIKSVRQIDSLSIIRKRLRNRSLSVLSWPTNST
jgi:hypothetical protein